MCSDIQDINLNNIHLTCIKYVLKISGTLCRVKMISAWILDTHPIHMYDSQFYAIFWTKCWPWDKCVTSSFCSLSNDWFMGPVMVVVYAISNILASKRDSYVSIHLVNLHGPMLIDRVISKVTCVFVCKGVCICAVCHVEVCERAWRNCTMDPIDLIRQHWSHVPKRF